MKLMRQLLHVMVQLASIASRSLTIVCVGALVFALSQTPDAAADDTTSEIIILKSLTKKGQKTRSFSVGPSKRDASIRALMGVQKTRGLNLQERSELFEATAEKPQIDLEIYFDFNSADLTPRAKSEIDKLGRALTSPDLQGSTFLIGGHTDAKGSADYNLSLSERRAEAVKSYLIATFAIAPNRLEAVGYGAEKLANPADPLAGENRRVQIVNVGVSLEKGSDSRPIPLRGFGAG